VTIPVNLETLNLRQQGGALFAEISELGDLTNPGLLEAQEQTCR
jgi:hypothetical protein